MYLFTKTGLSFINTFVFCGFFQTLKIPITEHALETIMEKLDLNKDGVVDLEYVCVLFLLL